MVAGVAALAMLAAACSSASGSDGDGAAKVAAGGWDAVVEAAKKEGSIQTYMTASQHVLDPLNDAFQKKYPEITVETFRTTGTAPLLERIQNDRDSGNWIADVVNLADPLWMEQATKDGVIATDVDVPSAELWDKEFWHDGAAVLLPSVFAVIYNTELVAEQDVPTSWEDMADPKWKGKMAIFEPREGTDSASVLYEYYLENFGDQFLSDIKALEPKVWDSGNPLAESVAAGESEIGVTYSHKAEALKADGAPVDFVMLEPAPAFRNSVFVAADAPHPNAARVYLDFAMSVEGQTAMAGDRKGHSVLDGVKGGLETPELYLPPVQKTVDDVPKMMELLGLQR